MTRNRILGLFMVVSLLCVMPVWAQESKPASERPGSSGRDKEAGPTSFAVNGSISREAQAAAPRVLKFSGVLLDASGKPVNGEVEVTFALYKQEGDEEPLWTETQNLTADESGGYVALLGVTQATGIPAEVFRSDEARWLGVQVQGQVQQPRTLLVSVPYALKAVEAEKLAGKSASDFVLSESLGDQVRRVVEGQTIIASQATSTGTPQPGQTKTNSTSTTPTTAAGPMFPPSSFSGTNATQIVRVEQNGSGNGLFAQTASATGNSAVVGVAISNSTTNNQNGVIGFNAGAGAGVAGIATNPAAGVGVYGQSANFAGVFGNSFVTSGFATGVFGIGASPDGAGVFGGNNATSGFAPGVSANSASPNGVGVFGNALATSGFATGVQGLTHSPSGTGVTGFGIATGVLGSASAATGFANGVFGQSFSTSGTGVAGFANASSGGTTGVFGDASASPNGTGVFGSASQQVGVGGQATATSGGPAYGVWGDSLSTGGTGVAGFADATSGFTNGVSGVSVSPNGNGVLGVSNATSGSPNGVLGVINTTNGAGVAGIATAPSGFNNGVYGQTASNEGSAVSGSAISTSGSPNGVFGSSAGQGGGIGVWGVALATSGSGVGVRGDLEEPTASGAAGLFLTLSPNSVAGQFANFSRQGLILQGLSGPFDATQKEVFRVDASGNLHITGNLTVDGTKSSTAKLQDGREVALYAVESPENWFEDFGSAQLNNGVAWVPLDASFAQAVNSTVTYHVFLTANGDSSGLYVARKTTDGFEVREHGGGTTSVAFDYRVVVRRRGYETLRMLQLPERKIFETPRPQIKMATGHPNVEPIKIVPPSPLLLMTRPVALKPVVSQPPKTIIPQVPKVNVAQPTQPK